MASKREPAKKRRGRGEGTIEPHPTKVDYYRARIRISGKPIVSQFVYGRRAAERLLDDLKPAPERRTLADAATGFMNESGIDVATRGTYEHALDHYLAGFKDRTIESIMPDDVSNLYEKMKDSGLGRTVMNQSRAVMVGAFDYARRHRWTREVLNPARAIPLPPLPTKAKTAVQSLTEDEREAVLNALDSSPHKVRWLISVQLGLRPAEVRGLTWDSVRWETGHLAVTGQLQELKLKVNGRRVGLIYKRYLKTESSARIVPAGKEIMRLLSERREQQAEDRRLHPRLTGTQIARRALHADQLSEAKRQKKVAHPHDVVTPPYDRLMFTRPNGDPLLASSDTEDWKKILKDAGLDHRRVYVARHTALSHLIRRGADLVQVSTFAGHADPSFTKRTYISNVQNIVNGMDDLFDRG